MNFENIYFEYKDLVYNLALSYVQNEQDAQEITQDVFLKIHKKRNSFNEKSSLKTWIYRISINTSLDFIKAKKRNKRGFFLTAIRLDDYNKYSYIADFNHPGVQLEDKESIAQLFETINKLPNEQKTVILLLRLENLSQAETSKIMGKSVKAIESLYQRAKSNLSRLIKQSEGL